MMGRRESFDWLEGKRARLERTGETGEIVDVETIEHEAGPDHRVTVELSDGTELNTDRDRVEVQS